MVYTEQDNIQKWGLILPVLSTENACFANMLSYPAVAVNEGRVTFIQGKSGCGKSTLLHLFNGTLSPDTGRVLYDGQDIASLDTIVLRRAVLLAGQAVYLFSGTIAENFAAFYASRDLPAPDDAAMRRCLAVCCAPFDLDAKCDTMSGGERQRVYLAVFLSFCPRVLMLDEPTSALDDATAHMLLQNLREHCTQHKITLVCVSHDASLAQKFADEVVLLEKETMTCAAL